VTPLPGLDLERYRPLLRLQARQLHLTPRFARRFDSSDLVQLTLLRAHQCRDEFRGGTEAELLRWLHEILSHVAVDQVRRATAKKSDLRLERPLQAALSDSSLRLEQFLAARGEAPDARVEREELLLRVAAAIDQLPADQRDAVVLRDLMGLPVAEVAARMGRTRKAAAGLLLRGRDRLRELLTKDN
jgi:RNA polymerase sigma-70 factor (ECF subfamily)